MGPRFGTGTWVTGKLVASIESAPEGHVEQGGPMIGGLSLTCDAMSRDFHTDTRKAGM